MSDTIRRHLETIFDEGNPPTRQNHNPQRRVFVLEMPIPGDRHEDVGYGQQGDCLHGLLSKMVTGQLALVIGNRNGRAQASSFSIDH